MFEDVEELEGLKTSFLGPLTTPVTRDDSTSNTIVDNIKDHNRPHKSRILIFDVVEVTGL